MNVKKSITFEAQLLKFKQSSKKEIGRRLLFLFQCDLLPGVSGKILELKGNRDHPKVTSKSKNAKLLGWIFLLVLNLSMLFYILLFAFTQTGSRQSAWFQSFAIWLLMEIIFVSTFMVLFTHILIPTMIMKDLSQIKKKLIENIRDYQEKVLDNKTSTDDHDNHEVKFNAAKYFFVSTGISELYPHLKESKIISMFTTPWPKQSYCRVTDVSKQYSKKFSALTRSASIIIIFLMGHFVSLPSGVQDMFVHVANTSAVGYIVLLHLQLYQIFPILVMIPAVTIGIIVHFVIVSGKADAKVRLAKLFPVRSSNQNHIADIEPEKSTVIDNSGKNVHQTRRASLQLGLNVVDVLRHKISESSESNSSCESDDTDSYNNDDDDDDDDCSNGDSIDDDENVNKKDTAFEDNHSHSSFDSLLDVDIKSDDMSKESVIIDAYPKLRYVDHSVQEKHLITESSYHSVASIISVHVSDRTSSSLNHDTQSNHSSAFHSDIDLQMSDDDCDIASTTFSVSNRSEGIE